MARKSNHRTVTLLQDFATKKAGEEFTGDGLLTTSLVNRGIAVYKTSQEAAAPAESDVAPAATNEASSESEQPPVVSDEANNDEQGVEPVVETEEAPEELVVEEESEIDTTEISGTEAGTVIITADEQEENNNVNEVISEPANTDAGEAPAVKVSKQKPSKKSKGK